MKDFFIKYKFQLIITLIILVGIKIFDFPNVIELAIIIIPLALMIYILGIREFFERMNILISIFVPILILSKFEISSLNFFSLFILLFITTTILITIILKLFDRNSKLKLEDFYNPFLTLFGLAKIGSLMFVYVIIMLIMILSISLFWDYLFVEKLNGKYSAKILIIDPNGEEEKKIFPIRLNVEVKDNKMMNYNFKNTLSEYDSSLLKDYNFFNNEVSISKKFDDDSVCGWLSKDEKKIISIKITDEGLYKN